MVAAGGSRWNRELLGVDPGLSCLLTIQVIQALMALCGHQEVLLSCSYDVCFLNGLLLPVINRSGGPEGDTP